MEPTQNQPFEPRILADRFCAKQLLKASHGIATCLGQDLVTQNSIIIKLASQSTIPISLQLRVAQLTDLVKESNIPSLQSPLATGYDGEDFFLVRPYVPGIPIRDRLLKGAIPFKDILWIARDCATALQELQKARIVHGDLKPTNIIIDEFSQNKRAIVVDAVWSRQLVSEISSIQNIPSEYALYVSPEQAGLLSQFSLDHRSDLYSLGIVLFECLSGDLPFHSRSTVGDILRSHLSDELPSLRALGIAVPNAFDEIIGKLLQKDPRFRYQSAHGLLSDLNTLEDQLRAGNPEPKLVIGSQDKRNVLSEPAFVGRRSELSQVFEEFENARSGAFKLVLIEGESGAGKTRLLKEISQRMSSQGAWMLTGQGIDQAAKKPFQLITGIVTSIANEAKSNQSLRFKIKNSLEHFSETLITIFPELSEIFGTAMPPKATVPETLRKHQSLIAVDALIRLCGSKQRPLVLVLDDCQWADEFTLLLLESWKKPRTEASGESIPSHILLIASFRSEEVATDHILRKINYDKHCELTGLTPMEIGTAVQSMTGIIPQEAIKTVIHLSKGNPFLIGCGVQGLVETGALVFNPDAGWQVQPQKLAEARSSEQGAVFLKRRLRLLSSKAFEVLKAAAVIGKEFQIEYAASLLKLSPKDALEALEDCLSRNIICTAGSKFSFSHDKLREEVLEQIPGLEKKNLHKLAAEYLENIDKSRIFELAYHYDSAGNLQSAFPYALAAAEEARTKYALEIAESQYAIANRGVRSEDHASQLKIAEGFGDIYMLTGRYGEAKVKYHVALVLTQKLNLSIDFVRIQGKLGELAFKCGDMLGAEQSLCAALVRIGHRVPKTKFGYVVGLIKEVVLQATRECLPEILWWKKKILHGYETDLVATRIYHQLAYVSWCVKGVIPCLWVTFRQLNTIGKYKPTPELALAYALHSAFMTVIPYFKRGIKYGKRAISIARDLENPLIYASSLHLTGLCYYAASKFKEAKEVLMQARDLLLRTGDIFEVNDVELILSLVHYRQGNLRESDELAEHAYKSGLEVGEAQAIGHGLKTRAKATLGKIPYELVSAELSKTRSDPNSICSVHQAHGLVRLRQGRYPQAVEAFQSAAETSFRAGLKSEFVLSFPIWVACSLRLQMESTPLIAINERKTLMKKAWQSLAIGLKRAKKYRNNLPFALREKAQLQALEGHFRRSLQLLEKSLLIAKEQGNRLELAQSLLARARVKQSCGKPGLEADILKARKILAEIGTDWVPGDPAPTVESPRTPVTLSLADRFSLLLDLGRSIATSETKEAVLERTENACLKLLRGETCKVISSLNKTLPDSIVPQARSILSSPIFVRGQPYGTLYTAHTKVTGLFAEDDQQLLNYITTMAGAALENTENLHNQTEEIKLRDEFLSIAAHELRTPLASLQLQIQHLVRKLRDGEFSGNALPERSKNVVLMSERQIHKMASLVNALLDVSQMRAGRLELELKKFDLSTAIKELVQRLKQEFGESQQIYFETNGPAEGFWDITRIEQIVTNLLVNAVRYGLDKPIRVSVIADFSQVLICVENSGIGISEADKEKIFKRFERAASSRNYGGLGLGLYIVDQIAKRHGGKVSVQSELNHGSKFIVELPIKRE